VDVEVVVLLWVFDVDVEVDGEVLEDEMLELVELSVVGLLTVEEVLVDDVVSV